METLVTTLGTVFLVIIFIISAIGFFGFNKLRSAWSGVIGLGGCYIILVGVVSLFLMLGIIFEVISGQSSFGSDWIGAAAIAFVISAVCLFYMVHVMRTRCNTTARRILLPFIAILLAAAFVWRLAAAIIFHLPMSNGSESDNTSGNQFDISNLPVIIYDDSNSRWQIQSKNGDSATYESDTGQRVTIYNAQISGSTAVTNVGNFHWY